jgi:hypothetical protein
MWEIEEDGGGGVHKSENVKEMDNKMGWHHNLESHSYSTNKEDQKSHGCSIEHPLDLWCPIFC